MVVNTSRVVKQYGVHSEYFRLELLEDHTKITEGMIGVIDNKLTNVYLELMSYAQDLFNDFNRLSQSENPLLRPRTSSIKIWNPKIH